MEIFLGDRPRNGPLALHVSDDGQRPTPLTMVPLRQWKCQVYHWKKPNEKELPTGMIIHLG